jgi:RNAse (barnase) inhibitor barstar
MLIDIDISVYLAIYLMLDSCMSTMNLPVEISFVHTKETNILRNLVNYFYRLQEKPC